MVRLSQMCFRHGGSFSLVLLAALLLGCGKKEEKRVYFGNLEDGSSVESPFKVQMRAENLIVEPATMGVTEGHGHFHILVDVPLAGSDKPIPADAQHIHYGMGQKETVLDLPVGPHTLILQFAKGDHVPYDPQIFQQIQITVTKQNPMPKVDSTPVDTTAAPADAAPPVDTAPSMDSPAAKP